MISQDLVVANSKLRQSEEAKSVLMNEKAANVKTIES